MFQKIQTDEVNGNDSRSNFRQLGSNAYSNWNHKKVVSMSSVGINPSEVRILTLLHALELKVNFLGADKLFCN